MAFQFQCPQGHLLEGDPSQAGQQCVCPTCGMLFIIPAPYAPAPQAAPWAQPGAYPGPQQPAWPGAGPAQPNPWSPASGPAPAYPDAGPQSPYAAMAPGGAPQAATAPAEQEPQKPAEPEEPELLHIPCPNGHELETPLDMLDQEVLCPQCQAQFTLRRRDSVEYKKKKEQEDLLREAKANKLALNAAIVAAVLVGLLLVGLVIAAMMR